jgi:hypothetical protein
VRVIAGAMSKVARQAAAQAKAEGLTIPGRAMPPPGTESVLDIFDDDSRRGRKKGQKKITVVAPVDDDPDRPKFGVAKPRAATQGGRAKHIMRKEVAKSYVDFDRELYRGLVVSYIQIVLGIAEMLVGAIIWDLDIPYTNNGFHRGAWWAGLLAFLGGVFGVMTYRAQVRCFGKTFSFLCFMTFFVNGIVGPISDCSSFVPMDYLTVYGYASCGLCCLTSALACIAMFWSAMWPVVQVTHYLTFDERQDELDRHRIEVEKAAEKAIRDKQPWLKLKKTLRAEKKAAKKTAAIEEREARKAARQAARADVITQL